jgi:hypothetical protein
MLESNPPRNSRLQTHQNDEVAAKRETASPLSHRKNTGLIDLLMPQKTHRRRSTYHNY